MPNRVPTWKPPSLGPAKPVRRPVTDSLPGRKSPFTSDRRWRAFRLAYLVEHPLCEDCKAIGRITSATEVHHLIRRCDDPDGRHWFDPEQLVALCKPCHSVRTGRGE